MPRRRSIVFASLVAASSLLASPLAFAQVSDADRAAARELYVAGVKAQEAGHFDEALDRFQRAEEVFPAPTNVLHIAECQAALGKLVESAESYRALARTPLGANPPPVFVQAQEQGKAELLQVDPRVPSVRVLVKPENAANLRVTIDGQPMSTALVGVERPTDPGSHTIDVTAAGYARAEQTFTLKEREHRDVAMTLVGTGVAPPPAPAPTLVNTTPEPPPPPPYYANPFRPYDRPPMYAAPVESKPPTGGFMLGPRLGLLAPGGSFESGQSVSDSLGSGLSLGIEGGFRFARRFYLGLVFEHGFHAQGNQVQADTTAPGSSAMSFTNYVGGNFVYISHPDGVGFYAELGAGLRIAATTISGADNESITYYGGELEGGVGIHIKAGDWVRLIPKITLAGGSYGSVQCSESAPGTGNTGLSCEKIAGSTNTIGEETLHTFLFLGVTGFIDFSRKH